MVYMRLLLTHWYLGFWSRLRFLGLFLRFVFWFCLLWVSVGIEVSWVLGVGLGCRVPVLFPIWSLGSVCTLVLSGFSLLGWF